MRKTARNSVYLLAKLIILLVAAAYITDYDYILKGIRVVYFTGHTTAFIDDHPYFTNVDINNSGEPQPWPLHSYYNQAIKTDRLDSINRELGTVAFVIIHKDSVWHESYAEGYSDSSQTNSFSMAKSVVSALLGKAIFDGHVSGIGHKVGDLLPQYAGVEASLGDLSSMASGYDWTEHYTSPFSITARAYYDDDLGSTMLGQGFVEAPGQGFRYLSGNIQLLAMALEAAVEMPLEEYLSQSFWEPMGFEQPAIWQVDDPENHLPKAYCCIASNALDFARFGKLYKDHGKWKGTPLIDSAFVARSIRRRFEDSPEYGYGFWLSDHLDKHIFVMRGILGQYVITIPEDDLIIVRLGHQRGPRSGRPFSDDFYVFVEEAYAMMSSSAP